VLETCVSAHVGRVACARPGGVRQHVSSARPTFEDPAVGGLSSPPRDSSKVTPRHLGGKQSPSVGVGRDGNRLAESVRVTPTTATERGVDDQSKSPRSGVTPMPAARVMHKRDRTARKGACCRSCRYWRLSPRRCCLPGRGRPEARFCQRLTPAPRMRGCVPGGKRDFPGNASGRHLAGRCS